MRITKLGHCCLLLEVDGVRIVTDPGSLTVSAHADLRAIDLIIITHEHADHCHTETVAALCEHNPQATVVANASVGAVLATHGVASTPCPPSEAVVQAGISIQAFPCTHAEIYETVGQVESTGYLIAETVFCPGDSFDIPPFGVPVLALPVAGPWCRIADAIRFAIAVHPRTAFPVHDGFLTDAGRTVTYQHPARELPPQGIEFVPLAAGDSFTV